MENAVVEQMRAQAVSQKWKGQPFESSPDFQNPGDVAGGGDAPWLDMCGRVNFMLGRLFVRLTHFSRFV